MKKAWLTHSSICITMGDAVAKNLMFETKNDHKVFLLFWKKYLGNMATLFNYHLSPTGWVLLFKTKSAEEIRRAYQDLRSQSKKAQKTNELHDTSRMLSEHFRILLSQYVRRTNAIHGRKGTKVLQSFHRYVLNEQTDYEYFFNMITNQLRNTCQRKKYQADKREYDVKKELNNDSIWIVGTRVHKGLENRFKNWLGARSMLPNSSVLRNIFKLQKTNKTNPPFR